MNLAKSHTANQQPVSGWYCLGMCPSEGRTENTVNPTFGLSIQGTSLRPGFANIAKLSANEDRTREASR